jgi:hypothetical protein
LSQNAEEATETAATSIWTFQHRYINPCFASIAAGLEQCTGHCFPDREERARRLRDRGRTRGRAELSFDFYDDWDEDDGGRTGGLLGGWGNDELDRLLAGSGSHSGGNEGIDQAPRKKRGMSYGTRAGRRKSLEADPTVIPSTNTLGFLGRLPFKFGGTLRYKPSAADLQEHPGASRVEYREEEGEPLIPDDDSEDGGDKGKGHRRTRSSTTSSGETSDSFRSRGDIFPSDGEDDAVPLDDEFAMVLERRATGDDRSSGKTRASKGKRPAGSRTLSRTMSRTTHSSMSRPTLDGHRTSSAASLPITSDPATPDMIEAPSLTDLQHEEERVRMEEDEEVERKRQAAVRLAVERGLHSNEPSEEAVTEAKFESVAVGDIPGSSDIDHGETSEEHSVPPPGAAEMDKTPDDHPRDGFVPARLPNFS